MAAFLLQNYNGKIVLTLFFLTKKLRDLYISDITREEIDRESHALKTIEF